MMTDTDLANKLPPITVYWRPGCPFCIGLDRSMKKSNLPYEKRNIWDEPEAAAFVRSVANGNEVVPTVTIGSRSLVNPSMGQIVDVIGEEAAGSLNQAEVAQLTEVEAGPLGKLLRRILTR